MKLCLRYPATCPMAVLQWQFVYLLVLQWFWPPNMIMFDDSVLGGFPHFVQFTNPLDPCLLPGWTNPLPKLCEPPNMVGLTQISRQQPETCFTAWLPFCLFDFGDEVPIFCWQFPWYKYAARSSPDSWCKANFHYPKVLPIGPQPYFTSSCPQRTFHRRPACFASAGNPTVCDPTRGGHSGNPSRRYLPYIRPM